MEQPQGEWVPPTQRAKAERINSLAIFQAQMTLHGNLQLSTHAEKVGDLNNSRERVLPWRPGREVMNKLYGLHYFKQMWIVALANTASQIRINSPDAIPGRYALPIKHMAMLRRNQRL